MRESDQNDRVADSSRSAARSASSSPAFSGEADGVEFVESHDLTRLSTRPQSFAICALFHSYSRRIPSSETPVACFSIWPPTSGIEHFIVKSMM